MAILLLLFLLKRDEMKKKLQLKNLTIEGDAIPLPQLEWLSSTFMSNNSINLFDNTHWVVVLICFVTKYGREEESLGDCFFFFQIGKIILSCSTNANK
ncbi:hypothetical protein KEM48_000941 [Puccinia striiformis f. sp. tritici PST-130]|nr:hypothetical protein KEM48_000941 [Puccinia striiformis f. sp. tritici PST-130]